MRFGVSIARAMNDPRDITHNLRTAIVDAFAVFNAPNSALTFKGNSNFYGQAIGSTIDLQGNGTFYWDKALVTPPPYISPLYEISLRELSY